MKNSAPQTIKKAKGNLKQSTKQYLFVDEATGIYVFRRKIPSTTRTKKVSLRTTDFDTACDRLKTENVDFEKALAHDVDFRANISVGQLSNEWFLENDRLQKAGKISAGTLGRYKQTWNKIVKEWPFGDLKQTSVKKITANQLKEWHSDWHDNDVCSTDINNAKIIWNGLFELSLERGIRHDNPSLRLIRAVADSDEPRVLTDSEIDQLLTAIVRPEQNGKKFYVRYAVEFYLFFGCRRNEAKNVLKTDVNLDKDNPTVHFRVTKNGKPRFVPIAPQALPLIKTLLRTNAPGREEFLLPVYKCTESLFSACDHLKWPEETWPTHHSFRDTFATRALEATNSDYFAVAGWLGHQDGGKLLAKRYARLTIKHSQHQIKKVSYSFATPTAPAPEPQPEQAVDANTLLQLYREGKLVIPEELKNELRARPANVVSLPTEQNPAAAIG